MPAISVRLNAICHRENPIRLTCTAICRSKAAQSNAPPPTPCYASVVNNPHTASNARTGLIVGGTVFGLGALVVNIVGFPEAEIVEGAILLNGGGAVATFVTAGSGFAEVLGGISALGDSSLVAANAAGYGGALGGVAGTILTPSTCVGTGH